MGKQSVVITNKPFQETIDYLEPHCRVVANTEVEVWGEAETMAHLRDAVAMMAFMPDNVDERFLDRCPNLKLISCALKGYDNFDLDACSRRGVLVTIVPDLLTNATAELAVGLTIGLARNVRAGDTYIRSGKFNGWRAHLYGKGLNGSVVGLVGAGAVGRATAMRLAGFGCRLHYFDRTALSAEEEQRCGMTRSSLEELLETSDYVIICLPLNPETLHLINGDSITQMKPRAYLVNISRGSIVDESAVADALDSGHLAGYAADVFELEDWALPDRETAIDPRFLGPEAPTVFTPHIGSAVKIVRLEIEHRAACNILQFLRGEKPDGTVNASAL